MNPPECASRALRQAQALVDAAEAEVRAPPPRPECPTVKEVKALVEEATNLPSQAELLAELSDVLSFAGAWEAQARRCALAHPKSEPLNPIHYTLNLNSSALYTPYPTP